MKFKINSLAARNWKFNNLSKVIYKNLSPLFAVIPVILLLLPAF
jgi:hypothetical protein